MRHLTVWFAVVFLAPLLQARRLPIKTYTTADGLARDSIYCVAQDSHGFLWFCTAEGLSRFDGYQFANYHTEQGLPGNVVTGFHETRQGVYWIATTAALPDSIPPAPALPDSTATRSTAARRLQPLLCCTKIPRAGSGAAPFTPGSFASIQMALRFTRWICH